MTHRKHLRAGLATAIFVLPAAAIGQGLPPIQHEFANGSVLRFYGQIGQQRPRIVRFKSSEQLAIQLRLKPS